MNDPAGINKPAADTGMRRADATADLMARPARPPEPPPPGPPEPPPSRHVDEMPDLMAKRRFDIVLSAAGLVALLPLLLLIALAVKLDSRGPVLFRQERVGRHGQPFRIHKFRTMVVGAEHMTQQHITAAGDERVTRVGCFLRRHKLDELPQLLDVWRGRMSLVGPRPQVPAQIARYSAADRDWLLATRPGITGLATLEFKDEHELLTEDEDPERTHTEQIMPAKLDYNREYYERLKRGQWTVWGDSKIILATLKALFSGKR